jgi:hypothetical protein
MLPLPIVRCPSCEGFGWCDDDEGAVQDCEWCAATGYVYRDAQGIDRKIPSTDYPLVAAQLEQLEAQRLREMGFQGQARKPWEQPIRQERGKLLRPDDAD